MGGRIWGVGLGLIYEMVYKKFDGLIDGGVYVQGGGLIFVALRYFLIGNQIIHRNYVFTDFACGVNITVSNCMDTRS